MRRWEVVEPGARAVADVLGGDPEARVWQALAELRCAPFMRPYLQARTCARTALRSWVAHGAEVGCELLSVAAERLCQHAAFWPERSPENGAAGSRMHARHD